MIIASIIEFDWNQAGNSLCSSCLQKKRKENFDVVLQVVQVVCCLDCLALLSLSKFGKSVKSWKTLNYGTRKLLVPICLQLAQLMVSFKVSMYIFKHMQTSTSVTQCNFHLFTWNTWSNKIHMLYCARCSSTFLPIICLPNLIISHGTLV